MNKIEVYRTHIIVNDYDLGSCPMVENMFKIYDAERHIEYYEAIDYNSETRQLILPRGMSIYVLENNFRCKAVSKENEYDEFQRFDSIQMKYKPRDEVQNEALKFMLGLENYRKNRYYSQLSVNLNTGKGKTYCGIATVAYTKVKCIIISSLTQWLEQWKQFILEYTDTKQDEICMMINSSKINRTMKEDHSRYKFILTTHSSLTSYAKNNGWNSIGELFKTLKIGIKFYDESHLNFKSIYNIDFNTNTYKTYYITATPLRSDAKENKIFQLYMSNVPSINLFNKECDQHTDYIAFRYDSCPTINDLNECKNNYGLDRNKYINYIVNNERFHKMLTFVMERIKNKGGKTLMYIGTLYGIDVVYNWIMKNYPEFSYNVCILTSNTVDKSIVNRNQIILSTTKSAGTCVDIKFLKRTVVLAEPFKSEVLARQTLGRTRDFDTEYIEIVDTGFKQIGNWYNKKLPIFKKYALSVSIYHLTEDELDEVYNIVMSNRIIFNPPKYRWLLKYNNKRNSMLLYP